MLDRIISSTRRLRARSSGVSLASTPAVRAQWRKRSTALVDVLEAHDVVLAEVGAGLHLDQVQRRSCRGSPAGAWCPAGCRWTRSRSAASTSSPRVTWAVPRPRSSARRGGGASAATSTSPGLTMMRLTWKRRPRRAVVAAPGAVHVRVDSVLAAAARPSGARPASSRPGRGPCARPAPRRRFPPPPRRPGRRTRPCAVGAHVAAVGVDQHHVAASGIAVRRPSRRPPTARTRRRCRSSRCRPAPPRASGALHHRVVDGVRGQAANVGRSSRRSRIGLARRRARARLAEHLGRQRPQSSRPARGTEHAAVPEVVAGLDAARGGRQVGLLDEALRLESACGIRQRLAAPDVAVAGLRRGRDDAEGDQMPGLRQRRAAGHRRAERRDVAGPGGRPAAPAGARRDRRAPASSAATAPPARCCGPSARAGSARAGVADRRELLGGSGSSGLAVTATTVAGRPPAAKRADGLLQQALPVGHAHEGLGKGAPRQRPQAGAGATAEDHGDQWRVHLRCPSPNPGVPRPGRRVRRCSSRPSRQSGIRGRNGARACRSRAANSAGGRRG